MTSELYTNSSGNFDLNNPQTSDRLRQNKQVVKSDPSKERQAASGREKCCVVFLIILLVICFLIGAGGIALCIIYFNSSTGSQGWKIGGIILGAVICIIAIILIIVTLWKLKHKRPWRQKKEKNFFYSSDSRKNGGKDNQLNIENLDNNNNSEMYAKNVDNKPIRNNNYSVQNNNYGTQSNLNTYQTSSINETNISQPVMYSLTDIDLRESVLDSRTPSVIQPPQSTTRTSYPKQNQPILQTPRQDLISFPNNDDNDDEKAKRNRNTFTAYDRPVTHSQAQKTQSEIVTNSKPNITETVVVRRVPIPTTKVITAQPLIKVVSKQPSTKVMIIKVPNVAGQLVMQPKIESTNNNDYEDNQ
ncbi:unnamed protein product [Adineta steineri]|uniref:Uncharacterized protein n=1 Tax=Adineta steineri TaxID=433720 RepID=A0A814D087_9BILA|nr:unnamed protein product [Adineta steineri]CAF0947742.1 unnamed protein product [Adineta steineri]